MNVLRQTISTKTPFTFSEAGGKFLVKNFSDNPCYVSFEENISQDKEIKVNEGMAQIILDCENYNDRNIYKHNTIYVTADGEIEVQLLD